MTTLNVASRAETPTVSVPEGVIFGGQEVPNDSEPTASGRDIVLAGVTASSPDPGEDVTVVIRTTEEVKDQVSFTLAGNPVPQATRSRVDGHDIDDGHRSPTVILSPTQCHGQHALFTMWTWSPTAPCTAAAGLPFQFMVASSPSRRWSAVCPTPCSRQTFISESHQRRLDDADGLSSSRRSRPRSRLLSDRINNDTGAGLSVVITADEDGIKQYYQAFEAC